MRSLIKPQGSCSFVLALLVLIFSLRAQAFVDDSIDVFFPQKLKYLQYSQTQFSVFWWNFVVIDADPITTKANFETATQVCRILKKYENHEVKSLVCGDDLSGFVPALQQWADDLVLREPAWDVKSALDTALGEVSFLSSDQTLFALKRRDPLDQWQVYLQKSQIFANSWVRMQGFLVDEQSQKIVIPVQFAVAPKMILVEKVMQDLEAFPQAHLVGAHGASYSNEKQVHEDMEVVSVVGLLVLIGFIGFLVVKGRVAALFLFPPVALAMTLATWFTQLCFGSIHGLTLAFGSGIIGLAVDYGLHGAFNAKSHHTWVSNVIGFFTTLIGLGILVMSGIPLIRQMMVYAVFGLSLGFLFFYLLCKYAPKYFSIQSVDLKFPEWKWSWIFVMTLIVVGIGCCFEVDLSFDLRRFNYQQKADAEASQWFFTRGEPKENYILLHPLENVLPAAELEAMWAKKNQIQYAGVGEYLPQTDEQQKHMDTWKKNCPSLLRSQSVEVMKVFSPFLKNLCEGHSVVVSGHDLQKKAYLNQFVGQDHAVSLFFARNETEKAALQKQFPEAHSLVDSIQEFSHSLEKDLRWMMPVAFLLCTLVLALYYRRARYVFSAFVPFFTGLGLFFVATFVVGGTLDLISALGLLMVFGFSLDYGIFATDISAFPQGKEDGPIVYSALGLAALSNVIGFFPLVFAKHPILHQLGFALFFGTIGTYLGTVWGVKAWLQK